jgi:hypothetical protein
MPVIGLPTVGASAVEVPQVVEAFVDAPMLRSVRVVEGGVPVDVLVRAEGSSRAVLEPCILPSRHIGHVARSMQSSATPPSPTQLSATASTYWNRADPSPLPKEKVVLPSQPVGARMMACSTWR